MSGYFLGARRNKCYSPRPISETSDRRRPFNNMETSTHEVKICALCHEPGQVLYSELRDRLFSAPGLWNLFSCQRCGLVWLNPQPAPQDLEEFYLDYFNHAETILSSSFSKARKDWRHKLKMSVLAMNFGYSDPSVGSAWKHLGKALGLLPMLHDWAGRLVMFLPVVGSGRLLDVGCGDGAFMSAMREGGWDVLGVEPDREAARIARERRRLHVVTGTLEEASLPAHSMDAITMNHVIEHVPDPLASLKECRRILRFGGKLAIATPNVESLGHRLSGVEWPDLDPPRHLHLFSLRTLGAFVEKAGLQIELLRSRVAFRSWGSLVAETSVRVLDGRAGQELILLATRHDP
jgi:2-polyprenyl-3-methyl-5-hydroxy-6-metoxy-1,4-benzoquinol methylase